MVCITVSDKEKQGAGKIATHCGSTAGGQTRWAQKAHVSRIICSNTKT